MVRVRERLGIGLGVGVRGRDSITVRDRVTAGRSADLSRTVNNRR